MTNGKRYLVYKNWNGQVHASIQYGYLTDGSGQAKRDPLELKRIELGLDHYPLGLKSLMNIYPYEEKKDDN